MKKAPKFSDTERCELQILHDKGYSARAIARVLGRSPNTIAAELQRNQKRGGVYVAFTASRKATARRHNARYQAKKIEANPALKAYVVASLQAGWNPDELSGAMRTAQLPFYVSKTAVYDWLYSATGQPYCQYLTSQQYQPKRRKASTATRVMIPDRVSFTERPAGASHRSRYAHWEGDTVVSGKRTGSTAALAVIQERKTRLIAVSVIPNLKPATFTTATTGMFTNKKALSLTLDNGIENKRHKEIRDVAGIPIPTYFCDPYSSWQKGGVENANKMLRRYFPKGCDLSQFDQGFVDAVCDRLNKKPRKILGYKSALQLAVEKGVVTG